MLASTQGRRPRRPCFRLTAGSGTQAALPRPLFFDVGRITLPLGSEPRNDLTEHTTMRIAYLIAGAGGMYCGSCIRDNRLAATLIRAGRDVLLIPLYTPIRTDELDVSDARVYYGGINVFLQQKSGLFRRAPGIVDQVLDSRALLRSVGRFAANTKADDLGELTVSVLEGGKGRLRKELDKLIAGLKAVEPTLINLPNLMFIGVAKELKEALGARVVCNLAGEDIFLDAIPESHRARAHELIAGATGHVDAFLAPTRYYAEHAARQFSLPSDRLHDVPMGISPDDFMARPDDPPAEPFTIGYLARVCPAKGLSTLAEAVILLHKAGRNVRLRIAGYLGAADRPYWRSVKARLDAALPSSGYEFVGEVDRQAKIAFLHSLHVLSVPTVYAEAKGLYVLEAMASGVPVVQPRHGSFPELIEATGGGMLYDAGDTQALADTLATLMDRPAQRKALARAGQQAVVGGFTDAVMADKTWAIYEQLHSAPR